MKPSEPIQVFFIVIQCPTSMNSKKIFFELRRYPDDLSIIIHDVSSKSRLKNKNFISGDFKGNKKEYNAKLGREIHFVTMDFHIFISFDGNSAITGISIGNIEKDCIGQIYYSDDIEIFKEYSEGKLFYETI